MSDVLARPKLRDLVDPETTTAYVGGMDEGALVFPDPTVERPVTLDPDDDYLVALAAAGEADYVVSGDRHLTDLADLNTPVLTPRQFVDRHLRSTACCGFVDGHPGKRIGPPLFTESPANRRVFFVAGKRMSDRAIRYLAVILCWTTEDQVWSLVGMATQRVSANAITALKEALSSVFWFKTDLRDYASAAVSGDPEFLAGIDWTGDQYKRDSVNQFVDRLVRGQDQHQDLLIGLLVDVAGKEDFPHLNLAEDRDERVRRARLRSVRLPRLGNARRSGTDPVRTTLF